MSAAEMLSIAAFMENRWAQAFPAFGSERKGAPVTAFCRISENEIRLREPITEPDALIIQDPTLLSQINVLEGLRPRGYVLLNSNRSFEELGVKVDLPQENCCAIPATEIALRHVGRPVPNAALLGAFCAVTRRVKLESVEAAIASKFSDALAEKNIAAAREAFAMVAQAAESRRPTAPEAAHA